MNANLYAAPGRCQACACHLKTFAYDATIGMCVRQDCALVNAAQDIPRVWKFGRVRSGLTRVRAEAL